MPVVSVIKGGIEWLDARIVRRAKGLEISVKAHPMVEEFMADLAQGRRSTDLSSYANNWTAPGQLMVRSISDEFYSEYCAMDYIGGQLLTEGSSKINLAFLRFEGISSPDGVKFFIGGPIGKDSTRQLAQKLTSVIALFVKEHLGKFAINLKVYSVED
jgi:hypothetical protein